MLCVLVLLQSGIHSNEFNGENLLLLSRVSRQVTFRAGAKLDVQLRKSSKAAGPVTFSRAMVLRRLHGHVGLLQNWQYRLHLFQVLLHVPCCLLITIILCFSLSQAVG